MSAEFVDYKRGPGFWFLFEILIAVDVCELPVLSAKVTDFKSKGNENIWEVFDDGLKAYERINKIKQQGW